MTHFAKRLPAAAGANVIPLDIMPSRVTGDYIDKLVWAAQNSYMNMLRVWGGGGYLPDSFYNTCSRCGILIWQEAMFACAFYPRDVDFLIEVHLWPLVELLDRPWKFQGHLF